MTKEEIIIEKLKIENENLRYLNREYKKEISELKKKLISITQTQSNSKRKYKKSVIVKCEPLKDEIWKENSEYPNYLFSNLGRIKEKENNNLVKEYCYDGYQMIYIINKDLIKRKIKKHRLIAETFIENPLNLPEVDHIDTDKLNNKISNLRWTWALENILLNDITFQRLLTKPSFGKTCIRNTIKRDRDYAFKNNIDIQYQNKVYERIKQFGYSPEELNI